MNNKFSEAQKAIQGFLAKFKQDIFKLTQEKQRIVAEAARELEEKKKAEIEKELQS